MNWSLRSTAESRKGDREDDTATVPFVQEVALVLAHDCLLYEGGRPAGQMLVD